MTDIRNESGSRHDRAASARRNRSLLPPAPATAPAATAAPAVTPVSVSAAAASAAPTETTITTETTTVPLPASTPTASATVAHTLFSSASLNPAKPRTAAPRVMMASPVASALAAPTAGAVTPPKDLIYLAFTAVVQLAVALTTSAVNFLPPSPLTPTSSQTLNGFGIVPKSTETVSSFYGRFTYMPGGQNVVQGEQEFDLVDPNTGDSVGTFDALVTRGLGYNYVDILVTSNDGINVGTAAGQTPPVGSLISTFKIGRFGWSYSDLASPSGDVESMKFLTPFGDFSVPISFDAAAGIADHTVDNKPMQLGGGYSIAPTDPDAEIFTGITGILPIFTTVQGYQKFSVYDPDGNSVGSFDAVFTTTKDLALNDTQALLVTANDGINVGTAVGQVPPVGSVYNVIYKPGASYLYSSLPAPTGDVVTIVQHTADGFVDVKPTFMDASAPPPVKPLTAPGGYSFVAVSEMIPSGVNGLPPREVEIQGYQKFDIVDSGGAKIGTVDADVTWQKDLFGIYSQAILVTKVTDGTVGTGAGQVPPVGSMFNFVYPGDGGFGTSYSVVPAASGDVNSYRIATPFGGIRFPSTRRPAADRTEVLFV